MIRKKYMLTVMRVSEEKEPVAKKEAITTVPREVVSVPKPSRKKLYAGIMVAMVIGLALGYTISSIPITNLRNQLQNIKQDYDTLSTNYDNLQQDYDSLYTEYASLVEEYQGALKVPYTTIVGGNVTWTFRTIKQSH